MTGVIQSLGGFYQQLQSGKTRSLSVKALWLSRPRAVCSVREPLPWPPATKPQRRFISALATPMVETYRDVGSARM